ncbi:putative transcriptional regulator CadC [Yersinia bercovieri]|uniref:winged helix-turn-helix domain-containing protein n=1 Tax=Yersinia bercovieri TaxID=634 RepID=UPI00061C89B6|nr:winged helix-turn-helix domain-containing protein [Yersinia bercovieri]CNF72168.1 putative transcriptional regulator CadC [Yersinia bercovieri]
MHTKFIINGKVCFLSDEHRLQPIGEQGSAISLNVPVSRCLLLLLQRQGTVISQSDFVYEVWESKGQFANANTYFQNIHLLRKALKNSGIEENIIKTVPKEGIRFTGTVSYPDESNSGSAAESAQDNVKKASTDKLAPDTVDVEILPPSKPLFSSQKNLYVKFFFIFTLLGVFTLLLLNFHEDTSKNTDFFSDYQHIGEVNQCQIYASSTSILWPRSEYLDFIQNKKIHCQPEQLAYIAINIFRTRAVIHICDKSANNTASCLTKLYIIENKNER